MAQKVDDVAEWDMLLKNTQVVVADFYADWCGPCKMIGPHFDRLASEYARPKKMAFAKVNTEKSSIAQTYGVRSMPTFKIFHQGACIETVTGANPAALSGAIVKATKLIEGGGAAEAFGNRGRTLGRGSGSGGSAAALSFDIKGIFNHLVTIIGLYIVSFVTIDAYGSAKKSMFNIENRGKKTNIVNGTAVKPATAKPKTFKTLADLGSD